MPRDKDNCQWCRGRGCVYCPEAEERPRQKRVPGVVQFVEQLRGMEAAAAMNSLLAMLADQRLQIIGVEPVETSGRQALCLITVPWQGMDSFTRCSAPPAPAPLSDPAAEMSPALRSLFCAHLNAQRTDGPHLEKRCLDCGCLLQLRWSEGRKDWTVTHNPHVLEAPETVGPQEAKEIKKLRRHLKPAT